MKKKAAPVKENALPKAVLLMLLSVSLTSKLIASNAVGLGAEQVNVDVKGDETPDPLEPMNRFFFVFNEILDGMFLKPAAQIYDLCTPDPVKENVSNVLDNLVEPVTFANELLQGKPDHAMEALGRFTMNSTIGIGGLFNPAYKLAGLERRKRDFGQTLAHYKVDDGPYLVLPVLGPSNFRDFVGTLADWAMDPFNYFLRDKDLTEVIWGRAGLDAVRKRRDALPTTDTIDRTSSDKYATYRVLYRQHRAFQINDGHVVYKDSPTLEE